MTARRLPALAVVLAVLAATAPAPAAGQEAPRDSAAGAAALDSVASAPALDPFAAGRAAGFQAAAMTEDARGTRFAAGVASGFVFVPWGVLGLLVPWPEGLIPGALSIGLYTYARRAGSAALTPSPAALEGLEGRGAPYRDGFAVGWEESIRERRRSAVFAGALTGAAAGAAIFLLVFATGT